MARKLRLEQFERELLAASDPQEFARNQARLRADLLLRAYLVDRNPEHVFEAVRVLGEADLRITKAMARNILHAWAQRTPTGNVARNTMRDICVISDLAHLHWRRTAERGAIPDRIHHEDLEALSRKFRLAGATVSQIAFKFRRRR
jgi:hypothetical protein